MKAIIGERKISEILVYGGISCVFWTLTFQTTFKYIILTLRADNHGEGGVFSLYALIKRFGKGKLVIPTILGAATLLADGIITPPISVASAVEGLEAIIPNLPTVPIVIAILWGIFLFQRFGTQKVGYIFGPAMVVWFSMLFILGFSQILQHPEILKALNPIYAYELLVEYPQGFWLLGGVFLCTTGAEALYSDLGHCGKKNIRITWVFVKLCLIINYNIGFRIQPKVELYFKKIVQELIEKEELNLHLKHDGSSKYNDEPDFKFVILEKFLSVENEFSFKDSWLLNSYFILKKMSISDTKAFGLDKSDVVVEELPIIYQPASNIALIRKK